jgi:hypothetical protein
VWSTAIVATAAFAYLGFDLVLALGRADVDRYESPLMLSVARQLVTGPWELYGPFGGSNPLVLIHAPLYYRVAGLLAWPMARAGVHPVEAARIAGRTISVLSLAATMGAAYRLGRLGGLPRSAGAWSALLVAASPVLAGQPVAVRPDMAGVALQTWGVVLALESMAVCDRRLGWASVLFGLSACVKQHLVAGWAVSVGLAAWGWLRGRLVLGSILRVVLPGVAVAGAAYGIEWLVTGRRVWEAAFVAAGNVRRVHPGSWLHVATVVVAIAGKNAGLAALTVAGLAAKSRRPAGWVLSFAAPLVATIGVLAVMQLVASAHWITAMLPAVALAALVIAVPGCASISRHSASSGWIDGALGLYIAVEVLVLIALCRGSSGAWINYGIPAMVFAAVLVARSLAGVEDAVSMLVRVLSIAAAVGLLASVVMDAKVEVNRRRAERDDLARIQLSTGLAVSDCFFADRPGLNRMSVRLEWVYDDWLYPSFESLKLARPRAQWLRPLLGRSGGVGAVVLESDSQWVDGIRESLPELGFVSVGRFGPFRVWVLGSALSGAP